MSGVLDATTSTALDRTTVHAQYNGRALGVVMMDNLIPIVLHVTKPGRKAYPAVLTFGGKHHKHSPYEDYGVRRKCCRQVILFNAFHYTKCYLDGGDSGPYTYNNCRKCHATLKDACGHIVQVNKVRSYNVNKFVFKASAVLQNDGNGQLLEYQRGNC
jgi:hypothetical protein